MIRSVKYYQLKLYIYCLIKSMSNKIKLKPLETSQTNLNIGLQITGKAFLNSRQWIGKFAQYQNQHQYPKNEKKLSKFGTFINENAFKLKINKQVCGLCFLEKENSEMETLCKCNHKYCYSCLNSYTIFKIQQLVPIKCPQIQCKQTMILTSNVYRYLPDSVKLQYLQHKHAFKIDKQEWENKCQRCLQPRHQGDCQLQLSPEFVEESFKYRLCPNCKVQIRMTSGKRKVSCSRCQKSICYLCGVQWENNHECKEAKTIRELQKEQGFQGCCSCCCQCCSYGCEDTCSGCGDCCCRSCGECCFQDLCCQVLFYCKDPSFGCCIWNLISIPVRLLITMLIILAFSTVLSLFCMVGMLWVILCFFGGFFGVGLEKLCQSQCPLTILYFIGFPLIGLYGFGVALSQTYSQVFGCLGQFFSNCCSAITDVWMSLSPKSCQY